MANVIVKLKIMPSGVDVDLSAIEVNIKSKIEKFGAMVHKVDREPIAFGLIAVVFTFLYDEKMGTTDKLEDEIRTIAGVESAEVVDCRRAFG